MNKYTDYLEKEVSDIRVIAEFPDDWYTKDIEARIRRLERRIRDFKEFLRDHRSQDEVSLTVERIYAYKCKFCGYVWDDFPNNADCCDEIQEAQGIKVSAV